MKKTENIILTALFALMIGGFLIWGLLLPDRDFSEQENRSLQTLPDFSLSSLFSGKFTERFEDYVADQFPLRDAWIGLKARLELARGAGSSNGIYLCSGSRLIEPYEAPQDDTLAQNITYINSFAASAGTEVSFALIPTSAWLYSDLLPQGCPNDDQGALITELYAQTEGVSCVDMCGALAAHTDEYIYYRTDHHWTTLGAYYGYGAVCSTLGLTPARIDTETPLQVIEGFYGTTYSSSGIHWIEPDTIRLLVGSEGIAVTNYLNGSAAEGCVYDESYMDAKDKYSTFFGGNTPLLEIETGCENGTSLLIIRDSYTDSLTPYLFANYSHISVLDLRYYRTSLQEYLTENDFDAVLICYSLANFSTDTNLFLLTR